MNDTPKTHAIMNVTPDTSAITTQLYLNIAQVSASGKMPEALSGLVSKTVYYVNDHKVEEFEYAYVYCDGTQLVDPIYIPAQTQINITVNGFPKSEKVGVFGCMVHDKKTGQIAFARFYGSDIPMAIPFQPQEMPFDIVFQDYKKDRGATSVAIYIRPGHIKYCKLTIFAQYTDTSGNKIIIPCDPELDNEDGPDPY